MNSEFKERAFGGILAEFIYSYLFHTSLQLNTSLLPCSIIKDRAAHIRGQQRASGKECSVLFFFLHRHCSSVLTNDTSGLLLSVYSHWFQ